MRGHPGISPIYGMANGDAPVGQEAERRNEAARAAAWHKLGLVVLDPADLNDEWLRQAVTNEANQKYGRRTGNGQGR